MRWPTFCLILTASLLIGCTQPDEPYGFDEAPPSASLPIGRVQGDGRPTVPDQYVEIRAW